MVKSVQNSFKEAVQQTHKIFEQNLNIETSTRAARQRVDYGTADLVTQAVIGTSLNKYGLTNDERIKVVSQINLDMSTAQSSLEDMVKKDPNAKDGKSYRCMLDIFAGRIIKAYLEDEKSLESAIEKAKSQFVTIEGDKKITADIVSHLQKMESRITAKHRNYVRLIRAGEKEQRENEIIETVNAQVQILEEKIKEREKELKEIKFFDEEQIAADTVLNNLKSELELVLEAKANIDEEIKLAASERQKEDFDVLEAKYKQDKVDLIASNQEAQKKLVDNYSKRKSLKESQSKAIEDRQKAEMTLGRTEEKLKNIEQKIINDKANKVKALDKEKQAHKRHRAAELYMANASTIRAKTKEFLKKSEALVDKDKELRSEKKELEEIRFLQDTVNKDVDNLELRVARVKEKRENVWKELVSKKELCQDLKTTLRRKGAQMYWTDYVEISNAHKKRIKAEYDLSSLGVKKEKSEQYISNIEIKFEETIKDLEDKLLDQMGIKEANAEDLKKAKEEIGKLIKELFNINLNSCLRTEAIRELINQDGLSPAEIAKELSTIRGVPLKPQSEGGEEQTWDEVLAEKRRFVLVREPMKGKANALHYIDLTLLKLKNIDVASDIKLAKKKSSKANREINSADRKIEKIEESLSSIRATILQTTLEARLNIAKIVRSYNSHKVGYSKICQQIDELKADLEKQKAEKVNIEAELAKEEKEVKKLEELKRKLMQEEKDCDNAIAINQETSKRLEDEQRYREDWVRLLSLNDASRRGVVVESFVKLIETLEKADINVRKKHGEALSKIEEQLDKDSVKINEDLILQIKSGDIRVDDAELKSMADRYLRAIAIVLKDAKSKLHETQVTLDTSIQTSHHSILKLQGRQEEYAETVALINEQAEDLKTKLLNEKSVTTEYNANTREHFELCSLVQKISSKLAIQVDTNVKPEDAFNFIKKVAKMQSTANLKVVLAELAKELKEGDSLALIIENLLKEEKPRFDDFEDLLSKMVDRKTKELDAEISDNKELIETASETAYELMVESFKKIMTDNEYALFVSEIERLGLENPNLKVSGELSKDGEYKIIVDLGNKEEASNNNISFVNGKIFELANKNQNYKLEFSYQKDVSNVRFDATKISSEALEGLPVSTKELELLNQREVDLKILADWEGIKQVTSLNIHGTNAEKTRISVVELNRILQFGNTNLKIDLKNVELIDGSWGDIETNANQVVTPNPKIVNALGDKSKYAGGLYDKLFDHLSELYERGIVASSVDITTDYNEAGERLISFDIAEAPNEIDLTGLSLLESSRADLNESYLKFNYPSNTKEVKADLKGKKLAQPLLLDFSKSIHNIEILNISPENIEDIRLSRGTRNITVSTLPNMATDLDVEVFSKMLQPCKHLMNVDLSDVILSEHSSWNSIELPKNISGRKYKLLISNLTGRFPLLKMKYIRTASIKPSKQVFGQQVGVQEKAAAAKNLSEKPETKENQEPETKEVPVEGEGNGNFDPEISQIEEMTEEDRQVITSNKNKDEEL